jgi:hypothetical protein
MSSVLDSTSELAVDPLDAIEDVYELSPMQQGMLYDTVASSEPGMYCIVVSYRLEGSLDAGALFDAWRTVAARHQILRASFHWHERQEPTQAVHRQVDLPVAELDWRALDAGEQPARLTAFLDAENRRGFDVTKPPLVRLSLIRCADAVYELVVSHHHLLLDGSCKPLLFAEVFAAYEALRQRTAPDLPEPAPYRLFIEWLRDQDRQAAERFWRDELSGFSEPTPLWPSAAAPPTREHGYQEHHVALSADETERLRAFARTHRLTLNTVVSGAWALLLGHASGQTDVVFGATVNARPPALDETDAMLGLFINTLPVRFTIDAAAGSAGSIAWLRDAQLRQTRARDYDYAPLSSMQRWSGVPRRLPLFESIIVFENNAGFGSDAERHGSIEVTAVRAHIRNSLPLTLRCVPGRTLAMQLLYETNRFSPATIQSIGDRLVQMLRGMMVSGSAPVGRLLDLLDEDDRRRNAATADTFQQTIREKLSRRRRSQPEPDTRES